MQKNWVGLHCTMAVAVHSGCNTATSSYFLLVPLSFSGCSQTSRNAEISHFKPYKDTYLKWKIAGKVEKGLVYVPPYVLWSPPVQIPVENQNCILIQSFI